MPRSDRARDVTPALLAGWPLPEPATDADKEERGRVLVIGGSREVPGAILLAGVAALRVGAGKLQLATSASAALAVATEVPEALVVGLPEDEGGAIRGDAAMATLGDRIGRTQATVIGVGMHDPGSVREIIEAAVGTPGPALVLDAAGITCLQGCGSDLLAPARARVILTPNAVEAAALASCELGEVRRDPQAMAERLAAELGVVVSLKGAVTYTCGPGGETFADAAGNPGLGTSGSGDVVAGAIGGLAARGADPLQAAVWGIHAHAVAGDRLAARIGPLGYLARELLDELPRVLDDRRPRRDGDATQGRAHP